jgi:2,3-bisphosphoglycerate-independent phosphoglycerate mutase
VTIGANGPVALVILDGFGIAPEGPGNAVRLANTPTFDYIYARFPHATLSASGYDVGLPAGQMGNSEVGHLNLGAGRVVYQDLTRIDLAIEHGTFDEAPALVSTIDAALAASGIVHVIALCSFGGVHSSLPHIVQAVRVAAARGVRDIRVHAITDGRDVAPDASLHDMPWLEEQLATISEETGDRCRARIVSVIGRYWAMDRDRRWDRTQRAWELIMHRMGRRAASASEAVRASHEEDVTDEFVEPWVIDAPGDNAVGGMNADDGIIFGNFRPDRMRQLVPALVADKFVGFDRGDGFKPVRNAVCLCEYDAEYDLPVAFESETLTDTLADVLEAQGVGQLHVAETEKYPHVTYFFNGGLEEVHARESRALAQSPRDVATYDLKPEMSAAEVAKLFADGFADEEIAFGIVNFANPDMVGHTGVIPAAIRACEAADAGLQVVLDAVAARGGTCIVTADHGNAETMLTPDGNPHTAHTTNLVPVVVAHYGRASVASVDDGRLADVAPTVLDLLGVPQPEAMTGHSLIARS